MTAEPKITSLRELAEQSHAWPFEEARKIVARLKKKPKAEVIFETGYGPSGLPHIGTFGEVARTTMVRHAFRVLSDDKIKTRLIAFSDDMDALRKVPDNVPHKEMLAQHLGKPLTKVPDPFGTHASFAEHNNARLRAFLDQFGFDYEFMSSTACYTSGRFDAALLKVLHRFDEVMAIMLPSLREERAQSYSPFLPISPRTGAVLQVPVVAHDAKAGTITYEDSETGERVTTLVTGGRCKLQWKPDWAMRWIALGVDYEMAGKDLIDSVKLSGEICRALGGLPPEGFNYELFLDENGQKISKSKGNGLTIEEWLRYASPESLSLFMYREPKAAKRLYFDVIPRHVDEYQQFLDAYQRQGPRERLSNPVWHIHGGAPPRADNPVSFAMLISLVTASNAENAETLWGFIGRYRPGVTEKTHPHLAALVNYAIHYFRDFVLPAKKFREPSAAERAALIDLRDALSQLPADATAEAIQDVIYEVGRREPFLDEKKKAKDGKPGVSLDWFNMLYQVLLGQQKGPRFGSFVAAYGIQNTIDMIDGALARSPSEPTETSSEETKKTEQAEIAYWLRATPADAENLDFEAPIKPVSTVDYHEISRRFGDAIPRTSAAPASPDLPASRVFSMLSAVTGMLLQPTKKDEPFSAMVVFADGRRSAIPEDFRGPPLQTLALLAERALSPVLTARLADVCWLLDRKQARLGTLAVSSYVKIIRKVDAGELKFPFEEKSEVLDHETRDYLQRALQIGRSIGWEKPEVVGARELVKELQKRASERGAALAVGWFAALDLDFGVSDAVEIAISVEECIKVASSLEADNAVSLWRLAARAYHAAKREDDSNRCLAEAAERLAAQAESIVAKQGSALVASNVMSEAIALLHGIPGRRDRRNQLRQRLTEIQTRITEEMSVFTQQMDLNEITERVRETAEKLSVLDRLFLLADLVRSPEPADLENEAAKTIQEHPLASLFGAAHLDSEGKVIHRTEGSSFGDSGDDSAIARQVAEAENIRRSVAVAGIEVVRSAIGQHQYLSEVGLLALLRYSPFVPNDLTASFARGLLRFFRGDFVSALYILTPLLENSLRHVLKSYGHDVTTFDDASQTQRDKTISQLFESLRSELEKIFGARVVADIERVFYSLPGPNLRHSLAHGLLHDGGPYSAAAIYGCTLIIRLCVLPLYQYRDQLARVFEGG